MVKKLLPLMALAAVLTFTAIGCSSGGSDQGDASSAHETSAPVAVVESSASETSAVEPAAQADTSAAVSADAVDPALVELCDQFKAAVDEYAAVADEAIAAGDYDAYKDKIEAASDKVTELSEQLGDFSEKFDPENTDDPNMDYYLANVLPAASAFADKGFELIDLIQGK